MSVRQLFVGVIVRACSSGESRTCTFALTCRSITLTRHIRFRCPDNAHMCTQPSIFRALIACTDIFGHEFSVLTISIDCCTTIRPNTYTIMVPVDGKRHWYKKTFFFFCAVLEFSWPTANRSALTLFRVKSIVQVFCVTFVRLTTRVRRHH